MAGTRRHSAKSTEFPSLYAHGLYASQIKGDGNCLFRALSDQLYGHQNQSALIRQYTIEHMRANSDFYRHYMIMNPVRRNPKRKTKSRASPDMPSEVAFHTEEDLQAEFDRHLEKMGQQGEWADNMEVSAFASAFDVHVRLWQDTYSQVISPRVDSGRTDADRPTLHIAYHTYEHYSSVRNLDGPHTGIPLICSEKIMASPSKKRRSEDRDDVDAAAALRASKRRSPPSSVDSDSSPEQSDSSSDESQPTLSQPTELSEPVRKLKLILKLRKPQQPQQTPTPAPTPPPSHTSLSS